MSLSFRKTMCIRGTVLILCLALLVAPWVAPGAVAWSNDSTQNTAICTASGNQERPAIVSDGSGGAIITWHDYRSGNYDIYAQRVDSSGSTQWTSNGVAISTASGHQGLPTIVSDGSGGAIITWQDVRSGYWDIYAQRVDSSGVVQWTANGVAICTASGTQQYRNIVSDGSGGAIITWHDNRSGDYDIYAQRVDSLGAVQWTANGVAISTASNYQYTPTIVSDGSGGAIITWQDVRSGWDVYAQRVGSSGTTLWTANGVVICTASGNQFNPIIVGDGSGGAIITWGDSRSGGWDIYAQRVDSSGVVQWTANGVAISTASGDQFIPTIVTDGSGGAIVTWRDYRSGGLDVYAQRVDSSGTTLWTANGVASSTASGDQYDHTIVSDGSSGAIITWYDNRNFGVTGLDVYAQRVDSSGTTLWTSNGAAISTASGSQEWPTIASDGSGGAIIAWQDLRSGTSLDMYAQKVNAYGSLGTTPPAVTTNAATAVGTTSATLNGDLTSMGTALSVDVSFEYGLTTIYGYETTPQTLTGTGIFTADLSGLDPDTTYHFRAKAVGHGTAYGDDMTFTTLAEVEAGSVSGAIYEQNGDPACGTITISAYRYDSPTFVTSTVASAGSYTLEGLDASIDYKVSASGPGCPQPDEQWYYLEEWYEEERTWDDANRVRVTANQVTPDINFTLSRVYPIIPPSVVDDSDYSGAIVEFLDSGVPVEVAVVLSHQNPGTDIQGFKLSGDYYDIVTIDPGTGNPYDYEGRVEITLPAGGKKNPKLFHWELVDAETGTCDWVKLDTTPNPDGTVSATVTSLSWFAIAEEEATPPPSGEGGCFIATAAYGTSTASELDVLRAFRDEVMLQNGFGSELVALYYEISPPLADFISEHEPLRTLVRELLVEPVVWVVDAIGSLWRD